MSKILLICGPTATGKTLLALQLAEQFNGELISADSRQVYKGMDVGTGKDAPQGKKIWGYDVVEPDKEFSVAKFSEISWVMIKKLWERRKLPIVVGGTGLYLKSLTAPPESLGIVPDKQLRQKLDQLSTKQLQRKLKQVAPQRFRQMNWSDRNNRRRLLRAIEVAISPRGSPSGHPRGAQDVVWVGLTANRAVLEERIRRRVRARAKGGMTQEVKRLMQEYFDWTLPAFSATGYREWRDYVEGKISREEAVDKWQRAEIQYMHRQQTWFKKQTEIHWFDISRPNWQNQAKELVKKWWYGKSD